MKTLNHLLAIAKIALPIVYLFLIYSCSVSNPVSTTNTNESTNAQVTPNEVNISLNQSWVMTNYSAFTDPSNLPDLSAGQRVWEFKGERSGVYGSVETRNKDMKAKSLNPSRASQFWLEDCTIMIDRSKYFYTITAVKDKSDKIIGARLVLDSNISPSISNDGPVMTFLNEELAVALGYSASGEKTMDHPKIEQPTYANTMDGRWTLTSFSAFMSSEDLEKLPEYKEGDVVWEFSNVDRRTKVKISKNISKHDYDFSQEEGEYNFWMRQCYVQIGNEIYSYSYSEDGNSLTLQKGLDPSIADDEAYFYFKRF